MSKHEDEEVGFGKPPRKHQFKPGQSGNPKGRPKGSRNFDTIFREIRDQRVKVKDDGGVRHVTKLEAALIQLNNKAASGDMRAIKELVRLEQSMPLEEKDLVSPIFQVNFIKAEDGRPQYAETVFDDTN